MTAEARRNRVRFYGLTIEPLMPVSANARPGTLPLDRVKVRRTFEVIVDLIKDRIFSGEYRPGDRLPAEREAAERLGVGRPAVREAYRALEMVGIVQIRKGKQGGAFIVERDRRTVTETLSDLIRLREVRISELTEARMVLETRVAEFLEAGGLALDTGER